MLRMTMIVCCCIFTCFPITILTQVSQSEYETVECDWTWIWNPESPDLEDWQILYDPRGLTVGPWNDITVADTRNKRVVRFTPEGELIEIIGRSGAGPGEFNEPVDVCYEPGTNILWVTDSHNLRISRFQVAETRSTYINSYPSIHVMRLTNIAPRNQTSYYVSTSRSDNRISLLDSNGVIIQTFGELFDPGRHTQFRGIFSDGYVAVSRINEIIFTGVYKPVFERWSEGGELLFECEFPFPETESSKRRAATSPANRLHVFAEHAVFNTSNNRLYVMVIWNIYEVSLESFRIERFYNINDLDILADVFTVQSGPDGIRFYLLDNRQGGVIVVSPVG